MFFDTNRNTENQKKKYLLADNRRFNKKKTRKRKTLAISKMLNTFKFTLCNQ
jgi:hypothetical protein